MMLYQGITGLIINTPLMLLYSIIQAATTDYTPNVITFPILVFARW